MFARQVLIYGAVALTLLLIALFLGWHYLLPGNASPGQQDPTPPSESQTEQFPPIEQAIQKAMAAEAQDVLALLLYDNRIDNIQISQDGNWATAWIVPVDTQTGQDVPTEPGLVILQRKGSKWLAYLPSDSAWISVVKDLPEDLLPADQRQAWMQAAEMRAFAAAPSAPISGYYLPYAGGQTMSMTQSVGHDRYTPSGNAHYAFDFAKPGYPSGLFDVHAARSGVVKQARWTQPNGSTGEPGNYIVLEDFSTSPTTYQLYLHFAQESIPAELRVIGAPVVRGQFLGVADDTGVSSGNHLHFMVHTNATSYWGTSIDITFDDVSINGGRPRINSDLPYCHSHDVCDTTQTTYVSGNFINPDHIPPTGGITAPVTGASITTDILPIEGWADDDNSGIAHAQFKALYDGAWQLIGDAFTSDTFSLDWDLCTEDSAGKIPGGPISLAMDIQDLAANRAPGLPGLTHIVNNATCPLVPPACTPSANQVALFAEKDYQGACTLLATGSYTTPAALGGLGDDDVSSIQVGANVQATLFADISLHGRAETFTTNDSNLADNRVGKKTTSSVSVSSRDAAPLAPVLVWPPNSAIIPADASLSLSWENAGNTTQYQARLLQSGSEVLSTPWQDQLAWHLGAPAPGEYTWQVKARNASKESSWSSSRALVIEPVDTPGSLPSITAPYTDTMDVSASPWEAVNWSWSDISNHTPGGSHGWKYDVGSQNGYNDGSPNQGYLTSAPIVLPAGQAYFLRFWYRYETEAIETYWDQRWVQISVNGGPFTNLLQLSDEAPTFWVRSPAIALSAYSGTTIRLRFYFATLDSLDNNHFGWHIDDLSLTVEPPPACSDADNTPDQAALISLNTFANGAICPAGDVDYYKFQASAGDTIGVRVDAQAIGSPLDPYLVLLDSDGRSALAKNDDQVSQKLIDSFVSYRVSRPGVYYLKVTSWDYPTSGGENYQYTLHLFNDSEKPTASFVYPVTGQFVPAGSWALTVEASDTSSGISHVQFQWHNSDWENSTWTVLGEDWDASDGWTYAFDSSKVNLLDGGAFYAKVFDWAGNWIGVATWNVMMPRLFFPLIFNSR